MLAYALHGAAARSALFGDAPATLELSDELIALSAKEGFAHWTARGKIFRGWARVATGQSPDGVAEMREGIATQGPGPEIWQSYDHGLLADALGMLGQPREALAALADAFAAMEHSQQRVVDAELYRMRGELELLASREQSPAVTKAGRLQAEQWFQKAIDVSRQCQARSFELRAAMSLARLWAGQGRRAQARRVLGEAYAPFTEGFESADLRGAKALLVELA
jgi:predicted ATPase